MQIVARDDAAEPIDRDARRTTADIEEIHADIVGRSVDEGQKPTCDGLQPAKRVRVYQTTMMKLLGSLVLASLCACLPQAHSRMPAELPDPEVGDMTCAPPMSIHSLLESMHAPKPDRSVDEVAVANADKCQPS